MYGRFDVDVGEVERSIPSAAGIRGANELNIDEVVANPCRDGAPQQPVTIQLATRLRHARTVIERCYFAIAQEPLVE